MNTTPTIQALVLDASPLITLTASALQQLAQTFYTTPGVYSELRDEQSRTQLLLWGEKLKIRQPKPASILKVNHFAKLTGDSTVLSVNDVHIIALAYEIELELNGSSKLRSYPGQKLAGDVDEEERQPRNYVQANDVEVIEEDQEDGFRVVVNKVRKSKKVYRQEYLDRKKEQEAELLETLTIEENPETPEEATEIEGSSTIETPEQSTTEENTTESAEENPSNEDSETDSTLVEEYNENDDDGEWITSDNMQEELLKANGEALQDSNVAKSGELTQEVALATGDFACQNVSMQIGISLMNYMSGKQIKRVRNYMYRCHACFRLTPIPKSGQPKHFCPKCGGATLMRCAVSIDQLTGRITPHLKRNFVWINRGTKYTLPSPLSKGNTKREGHGGHQHNKLNRHKTFQNPTILREDQKEYQQAIKDDDWQRRKNEKVLEEWVGGGSADNFDSPFALGGARGNGVRVGKGRFANSSSKKKK